LLLSSGRRFRCAALDAIFNGWIGELAGLNLHQIASENGQLICPVGWRAKFLSSSRDKNISVF
jgi:hypothetical protein